MPPQSRQQTCQNAARALLVAKETLVDVRATVGLYHRQVYEFAYHRAKLAFVQHLPDPMFNSGDTPTEVRCPAHSVAKERGRSTENIGGHGVLINQRCHVYSTQSVQAGRLK